MITTSTCADDVLHMTLHMGATGLFIGSALAAWRTDPQLREQTGPVLRATFKTITTYTTVLASVGFVYAGTQCGLKKWREQDDIWNGVGGGIAGGALLGLRRGSLGIGLTAAAAFAVATVAMEYMDETSLEE
jgi:hypothetical protein